MKGRPSKPTALKALQGNAGHRSKAADAGKEPAPPAGVPLPPDHLDDRAKRKWWERIGIMKQVAGWLTLFDSDVLAAYCSAYSRWAQAEEDLPVLRKRRADAPKDEKGQVLADINATIGEHRQALREMRYFGNEIGWSSSSRTRIRINDGQILLPGMTGNGAPVAAGGTPAPESEFARAQRLAQA